MCHLHVLGRVIHLPTCVASCLESYQLNSPVCVGQTIQDMAPQLPVCLCLLTGLGRRVGGASRVSGLWNVPPPDMHGRGMWWDLHCPCLDSPGYINLCFLPSLCLPSVYLLPTNSKSHSRVEGSSEGPGVERERGSRKPRRYFSPGENRKTSERFRTQPITSAERKESDR